MKFYYSVAVLLSLAIVAYAGSPETQTATNFGLGLYGAAEAGFNLYHSTPDADRPGIGDKDSDLGGFVGGKIGYVFNTGLIRPAIEGDMFYNRFGGSWDRVFWGKVKHKEFEKYVVNSGAFMENGIIRINLGAFQPYVGAGFGIYTESESRQQTDTNFYSGKTYSRTSFHPSKTEWAWQLLVGSDYYISPNLSLFAEYKFLNYMNFTADRVSQQLMGTGIRYHF
jgi:opacity protein-like surface antigen